MSYTLESFASECKNILTADPGRAGREKIRDLVQDALKDEKFIATYINDSTPDRQVIYEDDDLGFCGDFERNCFAWDHLHGPASDTSGNRQLVYSIGQVGGRHIGDVGKRSERDRHRQRLATLARAGMVVEHRMMGAGDAGGHAIGRHEVAAVHANVAGAALRIFGDKRGRHADAAAEARLFDRRRKKGEAE